MKQKQINSKNKISKSIKIDLEIDKIGGFGTLTLEEEKALSNYFRTQQKIKQK